MQAGFGARGVLVLTGFGAAIAQVVLLRELMVVFSGNEVSIGLMLAGWLFWTASGSALANRLSAAPRRLTAALEALLALALPATIAAVRFAKPWLGTVPGEMLSPALVLAVSLAAMGPFSVLSGALFTAGSRFYGGDAANSTSAAYLLEAIGSAGGGLVAGLVLVRYLGSFEMAAVVAVANLAAAAVLWGRLAAACGLAALALAAGAASLERISEARLWRGFSLVAVRNSVYGNLAVTGSPDTRSIYENGVPLLHSSDPEAAEEAVHYALLEHPSPRRLLLIGGGWNGTISQALLHPGIETLDYVELDPAILGLARTYFPEEWTRARSDPRVRIHVADGRLFLKTTDATFDVIVVNLPEPRTAQLNRFFTAEFYREASRRLAPGGLLSFRLASSENYLGPELARFLRTIHKTLREVFPHVAAIPGETVHFFAANRAGVLAPDADGLLARLRERRLATTYVREYSIPFRMTPDRMSELERQIRPLPATPVNRDFAPVAYYFDVALWTSRFHHAYQRAFQAAAGLGFEKLAPALCLVLLVLAAALPRRSPVAAAACTAATGFTLIGLEILLLLGFQAIYGYVYQQLAVLTAAFMAGIALGSLLAVRAPASPGLRTLAAVQTVAAVAPLALCAVFEGAARVSSPFGLFAVSQVLFPAMAIGCGMLGGYQFPLACRVFFGAIKGAGPGTLYAFDLAGSCVGAVLFSAYLVPVFGFLRTAAVCAMVSLAPAAMALRSNPRD